MSPDAAKRQEAMRALINIALLEGAVLMAVIAVYFATNNIVYLIGGVAGAALLFAPLIVRWAKTHAPAFRPGAEGDGR
jgi:hypothetical protein